VWFRVTDKVKVAIKASIRLGLAVTVRECRDYNLAMTLPAAGSVSQAAQ